MWVGETESAYISKYNNARALVRLKKSSSSREQFYQDSCTRARYTGTRGACAEECEISC